MILPTLSSMTWTMDVGNGVPRTTAYAPTILGEDDELHDSDMLLRQGLNLFIRRMERVIRVQNKPVCPVAQA